jgi:hypothetical protein
MCLSKALFEIGLPDDPSIVEFAEGCVLIFGVRFTEARSPGNFGNLYLGEIANLAMVIALMARVWSARKTPELTGTLEQYCQRFLDRYKGEYRNETPPQAVATGADMCITTLETIRQWKIVHEHRK